MSETAAIEKCTVLEDVLIDAKVEASFEGNWGVSLAWRRGGAKELARALESAVQEFEEFLRDHRSQDMISLQVNREHQNQCSACEREWEPDTYDDGKVHCANCGAMLEEKDV